ncbi:tRNA uridine-5-carboxymethylaminomethyl(34) synthesis GTPase MnmE [Candidatus Dependentiae bacterium]|nr:tRNA uridine-5-carboxymethylaminomethyl(34) synthesis GTPase MnmE [Candidatus Dependentiae bacterium]
MHSLLLLKDQEAIVALATPRGSGAIALIRLSGTNSLVVVDRIAQLSSKQTLSNQSSHTIHHGFVVDQYSTKLDEVLFLLMKAPKTFTGQDTIEISCHNNPFIVDAIIHAAIEAGARQATAGEFTLRGFLTGKFDLTQAEAINEIIHAPSEKVLQCSLAQLKGSLSNQFAVIETKLIELLTLCEASFEFLEEEQRDLDFNHIVHTNLSDILNIIYNVKKHYNAQQQIKDGIRISLIGSVNAGKSSLFNALLGKERAIVTNIAGTTRDSIEASLYKNGYYWLLIDTAGLRQTNDIIEQQGIEKSYEEAIKADIILLVIDSERVITPEEKDIYQKITTQHPLKTIVVYNKSDLTPHVKVDIAFENFSAVKASAAQNLGLTEIEAAITQKINTLFDLQQTTYVLTQRQFNLISEIEKKLLYIEKSLDTQVHYELVSYELKDLLEKVCELTGKRVSEEVLDTVFSKFCVGK